jgi:hypothetical protein
VVRPPRSVSLSSLSVAPYERKQITIGPIATFFYMDKYEVLERIGVFVRFAEEAFINASSNIRAQARGASDECTRLGKGALQPPSL